MVHRYHCLNRVVECAYLTSVVSELGGLRGGNHQLVQRAERRFPATRHGARRARRDT